MNKEKIIDLMEKIDNIAKDNYCEFEVALTLYLRSDIDMVSELTDDKLNNIVDEIGSYDSLFDINKEDIDIILEGE